MPKIIESNNISYKYNEDKNAVDNVSINIIEGSYNVILGRNGSGKSTLARLFNVLLTPDNGNVLVYGMDTRDEEKIWDIRCNVGMIFQNPDNQIIGTVVEEDIAFGPENLGLEPSEIRKRADYALLCTGMTEYAKHSPHMLSGGQKQRVAIAGILAMKPKCMILDESTSMLDPVGRREVLSVVRALNKEEGMTIILITHNMDEAVNADRVIVMDEGRVVLDGSPKKVLSDVASMKMYGLDVPQVTELFYLLNKAGLNLPEDVICEEEALEILKKVVVKDDKN